jgi:hypothetical protein
MTEVDTPIEITVDEEQLEALADGERLTVELDTEGPMNDHLEVTWQTGSVESEGAAELHDELTSLF